MSIAAVYVHVFIYLYKTWTSLNSYFTLTEKYKVYLISFLKY